VAFSPLFSRLDSSALKAALNGCGGDIRCRRYMKKLSLARCIRRRRGLKMLDVFCRELDALVPALERNRVVLALENMPYLEGFPDETETAAVLERFAGAPVKAWFDTGHDRVRQLLGWTPPFTARPGFSAAGFAGMHLNDVAGTEDDHFCPSFGTVDFAALGDFARSVRHVVFEPSRRESEERLARSLKYIRGLWA
jgi:sugar phosphate isomerase/epimerase